MSDAMQQIVERARKDPGFLLALLANPTETTKGYALTDQERSAISGTTAERLTALRPAITFIQDPTCLGNTCTMSCVVTFLS
jgi:hypothetical protein